MGAVVVYLNLSDGAFGTDEDRDRIYALADDLAEAAESSGTGVFDGDEFGQGQCCLFLYGPDPEKLFEAIEPVLRDSAKASGGYALKCYGEPTDVDAPIVRVDL